MSPRPFYCLAVLSVCNGKIRTLTFRLVIKDNPKDNYWAGYFFSASSGVSDYSKAGAVDKSIGYWVGLGGGSVEVEEQIVLDL
ncbi:hypothetical protein B0T16DRAFT_414607 [Cercophora newfieldiana]|uniref:Uncharacterized protein n=1 Tax=Cercophora newfieldiana TaxID=92897 RepID=A0AA40CQK1_9PEZI|nr:hypothetical protein B0T16DRAFT_414607 [Cercophora newfieldiana]